MAEGDGVVEVVSAWGYFGKGVGVKLGRLLERQGYVCGEGAGWVDKGAG